MIRTVIGYILSRFGYVRVPEEVVQLASQIRLGLEQIDEAFQQAEWEGKQTATSRAVITP